ncbi:MAG: diacylglycerol kinase family lipid kinase [Kiritimatiellae bacterium]|nr:diacylglycerol kinase family lipid kinase [Kiritimatiellia bacterium]
MNTSILKNRKVVVLINPKSGLPLTFAPMRRGLDAVWEIPGTEVFYQFTQSMEDGIEKARDAIKAGIDILLVAGGDGTVSTIGRTLMGSDVAMGVIPCGSGNGFARHFGVPLSIEKAVRSLADADEVFIDVGVVNKTPFVVTCSMAWDAAIVRTFEKSPVRGILPYIFAGVKEFIEYKPQSIRLVIDGGDEMSFDDLIFFTVANLSEYGGGLTIAPHASPHDGLLELVIAKRKDAPKLLGNIVRFFDGRISEIPEVVTRRFKSLRVIRDASAPIQIDGELVDCSAEVDVTVMPEALKVLVPR